MFARLILGSLIVLLPTAQTFADDSIARLPGTQPLEWAEEELPTRLMDAAHAFVERKIADTAAQRGEFWQYDLSSTDAYAASVDGHRAELKTILGVVEPRLAPRMERFGDDVNSALVAETDRFRVSQVRWTVLDGVWAEGLLAEPIGTPVGYVVVIPDAGDDPEHAFGLTEGAKSRNVARQLAEAGWEVVVPQILSHAKWQTADPQLARADYTDREWIYRQAFHMGRHVLGYEMQRILAAVDRFAERRSPDGKIAVAGYGEGGHLALLCAAVDPRIDVALVSGYFGPREQVWSEPIYRNVWSRLRKFGDAEIASLVLPRKLIIEHCPFPAVTDRKGQIVTPELTEVQAELRRIPTAKSILPPVVLVDALEGDAPYSPEALKALIAACGVDTAAAAEHVALRDLRRRPQDEMARRRQTAMKELEQHVQGLVRKSEHERDRFFLYGVMPELADGRWSTERRHAVHAAEKFIAGAREYRQRFYEEAMGRFDEPLVPFHARSRKVAETDAWTAYDVVLDVYDGLFAWGVLVLPKDLKPGERRPVVVCQHGRQGVPRDTIDAGASAYNDFAARLAERGFITYAPHNLYRGEDRYRWLDRKANTIGCSLFSFIIAQHDQTLRWLDTLPFVDGDRIAFYGLSYGGETAVRVPTILEKYCLSICSGDFNQWTRKVAATDQPFSFMRTIEWEMPYWNLGHTFDYAEMAYLMVPRPFMVERGHLDRVGRDAWVAHEFAKVRWLYAQLGLADRVDIEFFQGGHSINGEGTFRFLHQHLNWPEPVRP